ncbi:hypothetical protein PAE2516 [Pyrobaculum aerophilum str. IM2]|uniref:Uncharacterized protein n=1 Tax=Pyrobaculum aerophilum (strain ATCC 51768 / DSM 7523 / JCM 9630 / CIP 104966 / NBRC 100827 / IM2) TaxID=178306 RepID=Q8ZV06_PYRAE|nr:hypothetical protein PAE2516 [Pyrobaculum aerophilum str. IM2]
MKGRFNCWLGGALPLFRALASVVLHLVHGILFFSEDLDPYVLAGVHVPLGVFNKRPTS